MSDAAAAPVVTPVAAPVTNASTPPAGTEGTVAAKTAPAAPTKPTGPETVKIGGREYALADIEAAMEVRSTVDKAMRTVAQQKADLEKSLASVKDPAKLRALLKQNGIDEAKFAEDLLIEHLEQAEMTPEQRELAELRADKARAEAERKEAADRAEKARIEQQTAQLTQAYETQFVQAMSEAGLPRTAQTMLELVQIVQDGLDGGYEISPSEAAKLLRARVVEPQRAVFEGMTAAQLRDALGPKVVEALIRAHTEELQATTSKAPDARARKPAPAKPAKQESTDWISTVLGKR